MHIISKHVILLKLTEIFKYLVQNNMFCQTNGTRHINCTHFSNSSRVRLTKCQYHGYYSALFTAIHKYLHCDTHTCHKYFNIHHTLQRINSQQLLQISSLGRADKVSSHQQIHIHIRPLISASSIQSLVHHLGI